MLAEKTSDNEQKNFLHTTNNEPRRTKNPFELPNVSSTPNISIKRFSTPSSF